MPNALDGASPTTVEQLAGGLVPRILQLFASPHTDIKARLSQHHRSKLHWDSGWDAGLPICRSMELY